MTLLLYLPGLYSLVQDSARSLTDRSDSTPLVVGEKGSPLELTLSNLYFDSKPPTALPYREAKRITQSNLASPIPILAGFSVRHHPIVGTTPDYFDFRHLELATGRRMALLGECVVAAKADTLHKIAPPRA